MTLNEQGVWYQRKSVIDSPREQYPDIGNRIFLYQWHYIPTGKTGFSEVACRNECDLHTLICWWNRAGGLTWKYTTL